MPTTAETIAAIAKITGEPPEIAALRLTAVADETPWSVDHVAFMELARLHAWKESEVTLEQWLAGEGMSPAVKAKIRDLQAADVRIQELGRSIAESKHSIMWSKIGLALNLGAVVFLVVGFAAGAEWPFFVAVLFWSASWFKPGMRCGPTW